MADLAPPIFPPADLPPVTRPGSSDAPPPTYSVQRPQILAAPLPDSPSFFWGSTVQGEVFVKGLGAADAQAPGVESLSISLRLTDEFPGLPTVDVLHFEPQTLYPPTSSSSSAGAFPSVHRFNIPLPVQALPGTLNLTSSGRGQVVWSLTVTLSLFNGEQVCQVFPVEGTPQEISPALSDTEPAEVAVTLKRDGAMARLVLDTDRPRLGGLVRLGVEVHPMERLKTGVAGISAQPNAADTLRPLRRVRVEMFRRVRLASATLSQGPQHLNLVYTSGKSIRYPGAHHPPLRVLFTVSTAHCDSTFGQITQTTPYHAVTFFIRVSLGFSNEIESTWVLEQELEIRPSIWREPQEMSIQRDQAPALGVAELEQDKEYTDEQLQQAYRLKGMDVVGEGGTYREGEGDCPPPFADGAGPSNSAQDPELPTFLESQAQVGTGESSLPSEPVALQRLVPGDFEGNSLVGRDGLGGELGTWVEYDGYETFSVAPPSVDASYGAAGVMDPPQEGDDDANVVGGMMGRLGMEAGGGTTGRELIESLGLGEGSRVVDLHDDLPPGIDEPSLPALPDFGPPPSFSPPPPHTGTADQPPPSFAASEAAVARRRASLSVDGQPATHRDRANTHSGHGDAPPGYFGATGTTGAGPPAYS